MANPKIINYAGGQKIYNVEKVDQEIDTKVAAAANPLSNRLEAEIVRAKSTEGNLNNLTTANKSNLVAAINEVKNTAYTVDEHVTPGSTNPVQNAGVKEYVDAQDAVALNAAKGYTDSKVGELVPGDGSTVVELTGHLDDLNNAAESLVSAINNIDTRVELNTRLINDLDNDLDTERQARIQGDQELATRITQVEQAKQDKLTFDDEPTHGSNNPVKSSGVKNYVDEITGHLEDLETPAESLVSAINNIDNRSRVPDTEMSDTSENAVQNKAIKAYVDDRDTVPTKDSEKAVKSGGVFDAIRFTSVRVGETMYWHPQDDSSPENREVHSNNPFVFNFKGQEMSVETHDGNVQLCVLKDIPEGWHALDGKAELLATDYPDLAAFMPENVTTDGKIWLPYVQHKIIKVKY